MAGDYHVTVTKRLASRGTCGSDGFMALPVPPGAVVDPSFRALSTAAALAIFAAAGCAGAPPPAEDTSTAVVPPTVSATVMMPAPSASAAPSSMPAPPPATVAIPSPPQPAPAPSAAVAIDRHTCQPHPPAVSFEVTNDDVVVPLDAQGCPLGESHFKANGFSYQASVDFMTELQRRLKAGDKEGLADLANFPLRVNGSTPKPLIVKDRATFLRSFDQIYPPAAVSAVLAADPRDVACNYQGVMLNRGILWAGRTAKGHYGVIAVNLP